jgi:hypothetical protein
VKARRASDNGGGVLKEIDQTALWFLGLIV